MAKNKTINVAGKVLEHCFIKSKLTSEMNLYEIEALLCWCNCQEASLWDDMTLQEILNVYRISGEWDTWEGWAEENWKAAYVAWNSAVINPLNQMKPRE